MRRGHPGVSRLLRRFSFFAPLAVSSELCRIKWWKREDLMDSAEDTNFTALPVPPLAACRSPQMVGYTMEAVCVLMGCKPNWKESKNLLSRMTFMDELKVRAARCGRRDTSAGDPEGTVLRQLVRRMTPSGLPDSDRGSRGGGGRWSRSPPPVLSPSPPASTRKAGLLSRLVILRKEKRSRNG